MQTSARITTKQHSTATQQAIAQYLQRSTVQRVASSARSARNTMRTRHIGKNCVARSNARV